MAKMMSKSELVGKIAADGGGKLSNKDVKGVLESLAKVGYKELKKSGVFLVPGFAKFVVVKKAATKARKGINPFTERADHVQGEAGAQNRPRASREGREGLSGVTRPGTTPRAPATARTRFGPHDLLDRAARVVLC